jgi:hypothetical protein
MRKSKLFLVVIFMLVISALAYAQCSYPWCWVGGFYGTDHGNTKPPVQAFLTNMATGSCVYLTGGPYAAVRANWDSNNNQVTNGIDWWDFTFSCEHGGPWYFLVNDGYVYIDTQIGDPAPDGGWGDYYTNWLVLYSCYVVCSPIEKPSNWFQPWITANPIYAFHGIHIVNGFRTPAYVSPAVTVSTYYARAIRDGVGQVLWEWFNNVWIYSYCSSTNYDKACSVFYASCQNDTLSSYAADPSSGTFSCWYY